MRYIDYAWIILIGLLIVGCGADPKNNEDRNIDIDHNDIMGSWQVTSAEREGQATQTLDNTHFHFTEDSMFTNLPTQELPTTYSWSENQLLRQGTDTTVYTVHTLEQDSLEFTVVLQGTNFRMELLRLSQKE